MNEDNFSLSRILVNEETQTDASPYIDPQIFNFNSDKMKLEIENSLYHFNYSVDEVERLVSAVQGSDLSIRNKGRIISPQSKRFNKLLDSLQKQIHLNSRYLRTHKDQKILIERLTRSLAYAIDPASRYKRKSSNNQRLPLFSHQKYEHAMKLGHATLFFEDPDSFTKDDNNFDIVYSYQNSLCLMNHSHIFIFDKVSPNMLASGKEFPITYRKNSFGSIILYDYENDGEDPEKEDKDDTFVHNHVIMPIIDEDRTLYLVHSLGGSSSGNIQEINLKTLITPYDFSFIDVILSIPRLTATEAKDFLIFLYRENYLSAYVRSKLCQFLYENRDPDKEYESETISMRKSSNGKSTRVKVNLKTDLVINSLKIREWPELLGRFIALLDHPWFIEAAHRMEHLELPQVVKSIAKNSESQTRPSSRSTHKSEMSSNANPISPINPLAQYLLGIILWEFEGLERGDSSEFIWEFLCKSVFSNLYLNKYNEKSVKDRRRLEALYLGTKGKPASSKTRIVTQKAVDRINKMVRSRKLDDIIPTKSSPKSKSRGNSPKSPVDKLNAPRFLLSLIQEHRDEIITILKNIPRTTEEASPLFYPIALEVRDAMFLRLNGNQQTKSKSSKRNYKDDRSQSDEEENESEEEVKSKKSKSRAQSLQNTNKSRDKQGSKSSKKRNKDDQYYDDNMEEQKNSTRKNRSSHRAASASQGSQSSSAPKSRTLTDHRPSPLPLRKMGIPTGKRQSPQSKRKQEYSEEYDAEEDEYEGSDLMLDEEYEEDYEEADNNRSRNRTKQSQRSPTSKRK